MAFQTPFGSCIWDFERDKNYITFEAKYHSESKSEVKISYPPTHLK